MPKRIQGSYLKDKVCGSSVCQVKTVKNYIISLFLRASQKAASNVVAICLLFPAAPGAFPVTVGCWHFWLSYD